MEYTVNKLSGYRILKVMGDGTKDQADILRDLITASVEPAMKKEDVEKLSLLDFMEISTKVSEELGLKELSLKNQEQVLTKSIS